MTKKFLSICLSLLLSLSVLTGCTIEIITDESSYEPSASSPAISDSADGFSLADVPDYSGDAYIAVNGNVPYFTDAELTTDSYETYNALDSLGRCTGTMACIGRDLMPTEKRGSISEVHPTGWINNEYDWVDGKYLYNRCHLIGFQLTGENANDRNLITGTRYLNIDGMLLFENMTADYIKETDNHVMYRVTPIFEGDNLVASGVLMEGWSVEDEGEGICFCIYAYNVQPGVEIDYATGENWAAENQNTDGEVQDYVLNTSSKKFHYPDCPSLNDTSEKNKQEFTGTREELIAQGYKPCGRCKP